MKKRFLYLISIIFVFAACNNTGNEHAEEEHEHNHNEGVVTLNDKQQKALNLKLGTFAMRNLTTVVKLNGNLAVSPASSAEVTAYIGGNVKEIKVFFGDEVKKNQVLAVLEHPDYIKLQEEFAEIANKLDFLKKEYDRQKQLYENKIGAGRDYQKVKSEYNTIKAKYSGLKSRLQLLNISPQRVLSGEITNTANILSPINGVVNEIFIKVGTYVDAKDKMFEITDNKAIHADFLVYEKDVYLLKKGQKIHFTVSNRIDKEFTATIFAIGKEFMPDTRAVHIHAKINGNTDRLIPGMYISGHLHADSYLTKTLPVDAVVTEGTKSYIFVLKDEHHNHNEHTGTHKHTENTHNKEAAHNHHESETSEHKESMTFVPVEIITGKKDDGFVEIKLIDSLPGDAQVVLNAAYYLLADMKKEETEHSH
jgi:cobalt-zinc-cadmium efflux system membrane fusion protein